MSESMVERTNDIDVRTIDLDKATRDPSASIDELNIPKQWRFHTRWSNCVDFSTAFNIQENLLRKLDTISLEKKYFYSASTDCLVLKIFTIWYRWD